MGPVEHRLPDLASDANAKFVILQHEMDSADDRFIEVGDSVSGEEHDTLTALQFVEEDRTSCFQRRFVFKSTSSRRIRAFQ